jgi:hypothetical protein
MSSAAPTPDGAPAFSKVSFDQVAAAQMPVPGEASRARLAEMIIGDRVAPARQSVGQYEAHCREAGYNADQRVNLLCFPHCARASVRSCRSR